MLEKLSKTLARVIKYNKTLSALEALSCRELHDVGIRRAEIRAIAEKEAAIRA